MNFRTPEEKARIKLESAKQRSLMAIGAVVGLLFFIWIGTWAVERFIQVPFWLKIVLICPTAFTLMVDLINVVVCGRKLRKLKKTSASPPRNQ